MQAATETTPIFFTERTTLWDHAPDALLRRDEEVRLLSRAKSGDRSAREALIRVNLRLVHSVARKYHCRRLSAEDLVQEGVVGLLFAIERFDPGRGCRLSTYAVHWIRQAIARAVEQQDRLIRVPVQASGELRRLHRTREELQRTLGREPSESELARETGLAEDRVAELRRSAQDPISLETLVGEEGDIPLGEIASDQTSPGPEQDTLRDAHRVQLRHLMGNLCPRERLVLEQRYGFGGEQPQSLQEVGKQLRISREAVRQIELRAMRKLRRALHTSQWD